MKNKLAYLGFLGLLGFAGFFGSNFLFAFFANFTFFQYIRTEPDELFWANIRACATRGFFIFLIAGTFIIVVSGLLMQTDWYIHAPVFTIAGFALTYAVSVFVFFSNLGYREIKENLSKDE
ncbi:MAG: DUF3796 domain-containing protein [Defluviitaleaceae bacterium]|nr:DUF3796 domain-containing protein [Defluviitaleaceae bacterium]